MYVSEIKNNYSPNISFAAKPLSVIKSVRSKEAVVQLTGDVPSQVVAMVSSVEKLFKALGKLEVQKSNPQAQNCLEVLKTVHGYRGILETPVDGVILAGNEGKNWIVSSHGVNALRMREQNVQTGEIESSIFIHDKKVAKTDTKHEIPKEIEDLRHTDIGYKFGDELQTKLDDADYALVRVRRALSAPEFQAEIAKVEPAQILPVNIKPKKAAEVVENPVVATPAPVEKPVAKRGMDEKRISFVNSLLRDFEKPVKKPTESSVVESVAAKTEVATPVPAEKPVAEQVAEKPAVATPAPAEKPVAEQVAEKPAVATPVPVEKPVAEVVKEDSPDNPLVDLILKDSAEAAPVKRRGRPKGSVNKPKAAKPVQEQPATQVEKSAKEVASTPQKVETPVAPTAPELKVEKVEKQVTPKPPQKVETPVKAGRKPVAPLKVLSDEEASLIEEVKSEFKRVYATLSSRGLSKNTRSNIKNGYGEKLQKDKTSSRILNFVGIGQEGTNVGINVFEVKDGDFLHLRLTDKNNKVKNVIVDPQGRVTRRSVVANIKESEEKKSAYSRQELDELELVPILKRLKGELGEYNTYVEARLEKAEKRKNIREEGIKRNAEKLIDKPARGRKPKNAEVKQNLTPQQLMKFIQEQVNQARLELDKNLRLMMAEITFSAAQSIKAFGEAATNKLNELQENLTKLVDKG